MKQTANECVILLSRTSCRSSKKAKAFLVEHNIPHMEINLRKEVVPADYLLTILKFAEEGVDDVLKRSINEDYSDMNLLEFINFVKSSVENQHILKSPMLLQGDCKVNIGYNEEEIRVFLSGEAKAKELSRLYENEKMAI